MIKIVITREVVDEWDQDENLVTEETPTAIKDRYESPQMAKKYALVKVHKRKERTEEWLKQEIVDESKFDLSAVIKAVNGL